MDIVNFRPLVLLIICLCIFTALYYSQCRHATSPLPCAQASLTYPWPSLFLSTTFITERTAMQQLYRDDCLALSHNNIHAARPTNSTSLRIATFNIFSCRGVLSAKSPAAIAQHLMEDVINVVQPDIIIFQEVATPLLDVLEKAGYDLPGKQGNTAITPSDVPDPCMICIRKNLTATFSGATYYTNFHDNRGYVRSEIAPSDLTKGKRIVCYGTHLDIYDETEKTRHAQIVELLTAAQRDVASGATVVVAGDFNAVDSEQYKGHSDMLEQLVQQRTFYLKKTGRADLKYAHPPHAVFDAVDNAHFVDVFAYAQLPSPRWTTWAGTRVDWMLVPTAAQNITIQPGVFYPVSRDKTILSDHILVYADCEFR